MNPSFNKLKENFLSTDYPKWRNVISTLFLTFVSLGVVSSFIYLYVTSSALACYKGFLVFSIIWLVAELITIVYLFLSSNIPRIARDAIIINIAFANIWFGLFIFNLKGCVE